MKRFVAKLGGIPYSSYKTSFALRQMAAVFLLVSIIPALLLYTAMYFISADLIEENNRTHSNSVLTDIRGNIHDTFSMAEDVVLGLAINSSVNTMMEKDDLHVGSSDRSDLRELMEGTLKTNRSLLNMIYIETPNNTVYAFTVNDNLSLSTLRLMESDYEERILKKSGALYWFSQKDDNGMAGSGEAGSKYIRCASAMYDASNTRCIGIVSLFVRNTAIRACLNNQHIDEHQMIIVLDQSNRIITSNRNISSELEAELLTAELNPSRESVSLCGTQYLLSMLESEKTGWHLISLTPRSSVIKELKLTWQLLIPLLALPFVCVALTNFFAARLLYNLKPMLVTMDEIKGGNLTVRVPSIGDSTFDLFGTSLNETLDKYEELLKFSSNQEALLTISRLKVLRGQLSPHFLYNILDSVNWMLLENEQYETSHIITDLGYILRYSINESSDTVPLHEEIEVIRRYLSISQKRFESRLNYSIYVEPELCDYKIPRFLLQPIVENAVIHGVEKQAASSKLEVHCYVHDGRTVIDISNDGPSIPDEVKEKIKRSFHNQEVASTHIGLKNVYERIQLYYGSDYGLSMLDMQPKGTIIRLILPYSEA
ncbi:MAG: sensor histidine kinase [Oscillospiraceae bacterium]|nr:sensor histidine kinase [Oscillospiraceae bacterium]